jgi:hypothetical protein
MADDVTPIKAAEAELTPPIQKPPAGLSAFKSKRAGGGAGVETLTLALPVLKLAEADDFARLHPDEVNYWSDELCFIAVPVKGQARNLLHIINDDIAAAYGLANKVTRQRLALASKPYDTLFLCIVPSMNLDNIWNRDAITGCEAAKTQWTQLLSKKNEGKESYQMTKARDADVFPEPKWPTQPLDDIILRAFDGCAILSDDHAALARLTGAKLT